MTESKTHLIRAHLVFLCCIVGMLHCTDVNKGNPIIPNDPREKSKIIIPFADTTVAINDSIVLHLSATDELRPVTEFRWGFDEDTNCLIKSAVTNVRGDQFKSVIRHIWARSDTGRHIIRVKCIDNVNISSSLDSFAVIVKLYPPIVQAMNDTTVAIRDSFPLKCSATDINGDSSRFKYIWLCDKSGFLDTTIVPTRKIALHDTGFYAFVVRCIDDDGIASDPDSFFVSVHSDASVISSRRDTIIDLHDSLHLQAIAFDSAGGVIDRYVWLVNDTAKDTTLINQIGLVFSDTGSHCVVVRAEDNVGELFVPCTTIVYVHALIPTVTLFTDTATVRIGATVTLHAKATDDCGIAERAWQMPGSSTWSTASCNDTTITVLSTPGTYIYTFRAKDTDGFYSQASINLVVQNFSARWDGFRWNVDKWK